MQKPSPRALRAASAAAVACTFLLAPAGRADVTDHAAGGEGSVNDLPNLTAAALNDALTAPLSEVDFAAENVVGANVAGVPSARFCNGRLHGPYERANPASPTARDIVVGIDVTCVGHPGFSASASIERSRWWGWQTIATRTIDDNGSNPFVYRGELATACRAGTWAYRGRLTGGWNGRQSTVYTRSLRTTCVNRYDLAQIDLG